MVGWEVERNQRRLTTQPTLPPQYSSPRLVSQFKKPALDVLVNVFFIITIPRLVSQFKKPALVVLVTTRALPLLPPRTPLQPLISKLPARAAVYFPQQQQGGALGLFSPRQSILKPEWRLWWPFRWQGILRGQVSEEATRDLPKFVIFCESESFLCTLSIVYYYHILVLEKAGGRKYSKRYVLLLFRNKG